MFSISFSYSHMKALLMEIQTSELYFSSITFYTYLIRFMRKSQSILNEFAQSNLLFCLVLIILVIPYNYKISDFVYYIMFLGVIIILYYYI